MNEMNSFSLLINQIDVFIKKYYKNLLLKGLILFSGVFLLSFLFFNTLEFFGRFSVLIRAIFFYSFLLLNGFIFYKYIVVSLLKLYSFGTRISREQASEIIGKFFPHVSDKLLNTLQLNDSLLSLDNKLNYDLLKASINQKSESLSIIPFSNGINLKANLVYLKYIIPVFIIFVFLGLFFPTFLNQPIKRIVNYNTVYKEKAPFNFVLKNNNLQIIEGEGITLDLLIKGKKLPEKVYLVSTNGKYLLEKKSKNYFSHSLFRLKSNLKFFFEANGFISQEFQIKVIPKSVIGIYDATLIYPAYLDKKAEVIKNVSDLTIPEGTKIDFKLRAKNVSLISINIQNKGLKFNSNHASFSHIFKYSDNISIKLYNSINNYKDSLTTKINIVKDEFPSITVEENIDSISNALRFFSGNVLDDYGFSALYFKYNIISKDGKIRNNSIKLSKPLGISSNFVHAIDFRRENLKLDDKIEYYFEVVDNDELNSYKTSKSTTFTYQLPSLEDLNNKRDEANNTFKDQLQNLLKKSVDFQKNIQQLKKESMNSKSSDWKQQNLLNQIKEQQNSLQNEIQDLNKKMQESLDEKAQLTDLDKELLEKQELLQKLLDEVMDDELKDLLNKLEELLKKQDKNQLENNIEKFETKSEDINKQLDRSLEMLKRMQVKEKVDDVVNELKKLSEEQKNLQKEVENQQIKPEDALNKQNEFNKKFEELKKDLDNIDKLNQELKKPLNLDKNEELQNEISKELNSASEKLSQKKNKQAQQNQKNSSEKMEQLADQLDKMNQEANKKEQEEDMNLLRNILESLMILSFDQESYMNKFKSISTKDPAFKKLALKQRKLIDDTKIVQDSLNALAMRQPKIASFIDKELNDINTNFDLGLENVDEHRAKQASANFQFVMTGFNNLALMLNESLQDMQKQAQSQMSGNGSCDKPGSKGGKPGESESQDMKDILKKQLEQMQKGQNPGGQKPGDKPGQKPGEQGMNMLGLGNKEIAKMAAEQTAIRQKLEELRNELNKEGKGKGNQLNPLINELEQQEKDLINKQFNKDILKRQKDILTRLLESEKALMERGFEEKRESISGKNQKNSNQNRIDEYNNQKLKQIELLRSVDPVFRKYYKDKANEYFNTMN